MPPIDSTTSTGSSERPQASSSVSASARPVNGALPTYGGTAWNAGGAATAGIEGDESSPYGASARNKEERAVYTHGNNRLEMLWTVITAVIFIGLAVMGQRVWASLHFNAAPAGSFPVEVVAQQFAWNMHYAGPDGKFGRTDPSLIRDEEQNYIGLDPRDPNSKDDLTTTTLVLPVNRPAELILRSKDVTHSIWVPQLRFKQDLVPGMAIRVHFTPTRTGQYQLACAELCGMNHFSMKGTLLVLTQAQHTELMATPKAQFQSKLNELLGGYEVGVVYDENGTKIGSSY